MSLLKTIGLNVKCALIVAACRVFEIVLPSPAWAWLECIERANVGGRWA